MTGPAFLCPLFGLSGDLSTRKLPGDALNPCRHLNAGIDRNLACRPDFAVAVSLGCVLCNPYSKAIPSPSLSSAGL